MTHLAFPSEYFPAQPAITLQIPEDWEPVHATDAVMAARRAADDGTFIPNVVVRVERRPAGFATSDALAELKAFVAERPHGTTSEPFTTELDGQPFLGCDLSWVDDQVGTVLQAHLFGGVPSGPFFQLVQVTGSVGGAGTQEDYPAVKAIMNSLTVAAPET
jgi:hypothetical protein